MSNYLIQGETLTGIADAIRGKTGDTALLSPIGMAAAIAGIQTGGGSGGSGGGSGVVAVAEKEVNFYDYDGTCRYAYTVAEAQALSELPAGPEHEGLIFQKWNWSLENVKALTRPMNIGALYTTDDGTTRIYIHLEEGRTSPMLGVGVNGTVTVDWGDGTDPDTLTGTKDSTVQWTSNHEYAKPGDYVIKLNVDGTARISGSNDSFKPTWILRYSSDEDNRNYAYANTVRRVECGNNIKIGMNAFYNCGALESIVIPDGTKLAGYDWLFTNCFALKTIILPNSMSGIYGNIFTNCHSLATIIMHDGMTYSGGCNCISLKSITMPNSITTIYNGDYKGDYGLETVVMSNGITTIESQAFANCHALRRCDFSEHNAVPTLEAADAFELTPPDMEIRVPAALYDEWIAATNWSTLASQIVPVGGVPQ